MVSKWVKIFLKINDQLSSIQMDTVVLAPSPYAEFLPPLAVFQACGLVLIFSVFVDVTKSPDPSGVAPITRPCLAQQGVGKLEEDCWKKDIPFPGSDGQEVIFYNVVVGSLGQLMFSTALLQVFQ